MKNQTKQVVQNKLQFKSAKNYFASLILVLGLFFSFTEKGVTQCQTGFTSATFSYTVPNTDCSTTITYCYKQTSNSFTITNLNIIFPMNCLPQTYSALDFENFFQDMYPRTLNNATQYLVQNYVPCGLVNINTNPPIFIQFIMASCYKYKKVGYSAQAYPGGSFTGITIENCHQNVYCKKIYSSCIDMTTSPPTIVNTLLSAEIIDDFLLGCTSPFPMTLNPASFEEESVCGTVNCGTN